METTEVLDLLSQLANGLPIEAMQWSLDHWEEVWPEFAARLEMPSDVFVPHDPRFLIVHLAGDRGEARAHAPICRLIRRDPDQVEGVIGETITSGLRGILISTFDGDPAALQSVIEEEGAEPFVRVAALDALTYLGLFGRLPELDLETYVASLFDKLGPRKESYIWVGLAEAVARLGYADLAGRVQKLYETDLIDETSLTREEFEDLLGTAVDEGPEAAFRYDRIQPYGNAIEYLSSWYSYRQDEEDDFDFEDEEEEFIEEPAVNPFRDIGRNDPCPCGSGKKFKKCCWSKVQSTLV